MDKLKIILFKIIARTFDNLELHATLARLSARYIKEIHPVNKRERAASISKESVVTILVLDCDRHRGDIDSFSKEPAVRCLEVAPIFLQNLLASFVRESNENENEKKEKKKSHVASSSERWEFSRPEKDLFIAHDWKRCREYLEKNLPEVYDIFGIKSVVNVSL